MDKVEQEFEFSFYWNVYHAKQVPFKSIVIFNTAGRKQLVAKYLKEAGGYKVAIKLFS